MPASDNWLTSGFMKSSGMWRVLPATFFSGTFFRTVLRHHMQRHRAAALFGDGDGEGAGIEEAFCASTALSMARI